MRTLECSNHVEHARVVYCNLEQDQWFSMCCRVGATSSTRALSMVVVYVSPMVVLVSNNAAVTITWLSSVATVRLQLISQHCY
eukprot:12717-Heterococcus_DN1.PRE.1